MWGLQRKEGNEKKRKEISFAINIFKAIGPSKSVRISQLQPMETLILFRIIQWHPARRCSLIACFLALLEYKFDKLAALTRGLTNTIDKRLGQARVVL